MGGKEELDKLEYAKLISSYLVFFTCSLLPKKTCTTRIISGPNFPFGQVADRSEILLRMTTVGPGINQGLCGAHGHGFGDNWTQLAHSPTSSSARGRLQHVMARSEANSWNLMAKPKQEWGRYTYITISIYSTYYQNS